MKERDTWEKLYTYVCVARVALHFLIDFTFQEPRERRPINGAVEL